MPTISRPLRASGKPWHWIGVGSVKFWSIKASITYSKDLRKETNSWRPTEVICNFRRPFGNETGLNTCCLWIIHIFLKNGKILTRKATLVEGKHRLGAALHSSNCYLFLPSQFFNFILLTWEKKKMLSISRDLHRTHLLCDLTPLTNSLVWQISWTRRSKKDRSPKDFTSRLSNHIGSPTRKKLEFSVQPKGTDACFLPSSLFNEKCINIIF